MVGASGCTSLLGTDEISLCDRSMVGWPEYQADPSNSGQVTSSLPSGELTTDQIYAVDDRRGGIAIDPTGRLYFGSNNQFFAINAVDGTEIWSVELRGTIETTPTVYCDTVLVSAGSAVHAIDRADGSTVWRTTLGLIPSPLALTGDTVVATALGTVYGLALRGGRQRWSFDGRGGAKHGLGIGKTRMFVTSTKGYVFGVGIKDGTEEWSATLDAPSRSMPSYADGAVFVTDNEGRIYRIDANSGRVDWRQRVADERTPSPTVAESLVVVASGNGDRVTALDQAKGDVKWSLDTGPVLVPPVVTPHQVVIGTMNRGLFVVSHDGSVIARIDEPNVGSPMALTPDGLYFKTRFPKPQAVRLHA